MPIATGIFKRLAIKRQAGLGVKAPAGAAGTARYLRRVSSTIALAKANYSSAEILVSQQIRDMRHGVRSVAGSISGELSVGGYQQPFESVLRRAAAVGGANVSSVTTVASGGAGSFIATLTRSADSWIGDGFKIGDVVIMQGSAIVNNDNRNLLIIGLTPLVMTVRVLNGTDLISGGGGAGMSVLFRGKKIFIPESGHSRDYYTIEHFYSDIPDSEQFTDCVFTGANIGLPATGMATVEFPVMGLDMQTGNVEYFTNPAPAAIGNILASVNGVLMINSLVVADVTGLTITISGNYTVPGGVVGSNVDPDIFPGTLGVSGSATALFRSSALRQLFLDESEFGIAAVLTGDNTANASFTSFVMPRCKFGGSEKDDTAGGLSQTMPFTALENVAGGAGINSERTTISIQDSAFV